MNYRSIPLFLLALTFSGCIQRKAKKPVPTVTIDAADPFDQPATLETHSLFVEDISTLAIEDDSEHNLMQALSDGSPASSTDLIHAQQQAQLSFDAGRAQAEELGLFKRIYFDFDAYDVRPDQEATLAIDIQQARSAAERGDAIVVEGHACNSAGSGTYNLMLSEKRAQSVAKALLEAGIPAAQIKIVGRGSEMPLVPGGDRIQQSPNRRVELYVLAR